MSKETLKALLGRFLDEVANLEASDTPDNDVPDVFKSFIDKMDDTD